MRGTIDKAGRLVIPKPLREAAGLTAGEVELTHDGSGVRIEPVSGVGMVEEAGLLLINEELELSDDQLRSFRLDDQR